MVLDPESNESSKRKIDEEPADPRSSKRKVDDAPLDLRDRRKQFDRASMPPPRNTRLLRAIKQESKLDRCPFWAMRQAGRYLPEFRELRAEHLFFEVCQNPTLAAEVTLQPLRRYPDLDAVIIFCDILVIPVAMGMPCEMVAGKGPTFNEPLTVETLEKLILEPDVEESLGYVFDAIHFTKLCMEKESALESVPIIGFSGAPWSLFGYMVEGGGSRTWSKAKSWLYSDEGTVCKLLAAIRDISIRYLIKQYDAGASYLQVFDTNAGELPPHVYNRLIVPDLLVIAKEIKRQRPNALLCIFAKDAQLAAFKDSEYDVVGVSWKTAVADAIAQCPNKTLQGNLDPCALLAPEDVIRAEVKSMRESFSSAAGYVCNLGHGMMPEHSVDALRIVLETLKQ